MALQFDPSAILALLADLTANVDHLGKENAQLRAALETATSAKDSTEPAPPA